MDRFSIHDFICNQTSLCKVTLTGQSRSDFMAEITEFQQQYNEDILDESGCIEAIEVITSFMIASS